MTSECSTLYLEPLDTYLTGPITATCLADFIAACGATLDDPGVNPAEMPLGPTQVDKTPLVLVEMHVDGATTAEIQAKLSALSLHPATMTETLAALAVEREMVDRLPTLLCIGSALQTANLLQIPCITLNGSNLSVGMFNGDEATWYGHYVFFATK